MKPNTARWLRALFYAYVAVTFAHIAYVVYREPFAFDAWNVALDTHAQPFSASRFFSFWHQQYTSSNPRIGQPFAYLAYKLVGVAEIGTPLAFFSIVVGGFVIGTGRWPDRRNGRDLATLTIGIGFMWFAAPNFPAYMFCRAYATNYLWAAAIQIWFLVPLRLGTVVRGTIPKQALWLIAYCVLGIAAGMGNEHVGPTLLLFLLALVGWTSRAAWRTKHARPLLLWTGTMGAIIGYALIFFAPGQSSRYEGLAERYTVVQQIIVRGVRGNVDIFRGLLDAAAPLLLVLFVVITVGVLLERRVGDEFDTARGTQKRAVAAITAALIAATLITATVFASPKLGPRFYMHAMFLVLAGGMGVVSAYLHRARSFVPFVAIALISSTYAFARTVPMFTRLDRDSDQRLAELAAAPSGSSYTAGAWEQIPESWWFLGDDLRDQKKQEMLASYFDLQRVLFRGGDLWKTLGVTDVKLTMHYDLQPPVCLDEIDQLDLKPYVGRDIEALEHAFLDTIVEIQRGTSSHLHAVELRATFLGKQPPMPSQTIFVARWNEGVLEGYTAQLGRAGRSKERRIILSPKLTETPWDIYVTVVGEAPRKLGVSTQASSFTYAPWTSGQYWALACKPDYCFVVLVVSHAI